MGRIAMQRFTFEERAKHAKNSAAQKLFHLMHTKQTNLALAADVTSAEALLGLADAVGPHVCVLKTHIDFIEDFSSDLIERLQAMAREHNFLIFEDRKFADIGSTTQKQYEKGVYKISSWADLVTVHGIPGPGQIDGLAEVGQSLGRGCLLLAEMSSKGQLADGAYRDGVLAMAKSHPEFVAGLICQRRLLDDPGVVHMAPGIRFAVEANDGLGQQYTSPEQAISEHGIDVIIVGRGIVQAASPVDEAQLYRQAAWSAASG